MNEIFLKNNSLEQFRMKESFEEIAPIVSRMRHLTSEYIKRSSLQSLVLGISGGVDSAFAAALLESVCKDLGIPLIGRSITIETNKQNEIDRSIAVGKAFCDSFEYLDLSELYQSHKRFLSGLQDDMLSKLRMGNCKARIRMMVLYDLAQQHKGMVISTDNFTEYLTGFWTLHGDVGDYAPFIHLWKTEVYLACEYLCQSLSPSREAALRSCMEALPTDGLGISNSDLDQLGVASYAEVDRIFWDYFNGNDSLKEHVLIKRYLRSEYKRRNPFIIERNELLLV